MQLSEGQIITLEIPVAARNEELENHVGAIWYLIQHY